jgi:hypothetical protein
MKFMVLKFDSQLKHNLGISIFSTFKMGISLFLFIFSKKIGMEIQIKKKKYTNINEIAEYKKKTTLKFQQ